MDEIFTGNPPALDLTPRAGVLASEEVIGRVARIPSPSPRRKLLQGLALLWHDHWDGAHAIAQAHEGQADFDLLHAIGHRRDGDFSNSKYWFGSAGNHPCFAALEKSLAKELGEDAPLRKTLLPRGRWSPSAFVNEVSALPTPVRNSPEKAGQLFRVQELEMRAFADWLISG